MKVKLKLLSKNYTIIHSWHSYLLSSFFVGGGVPRMCVAIGIAVIGILDGFGEVGS